MKDKKPVFRNKYNYVMTHEKTHGTSLTVQGLAITISELIRKRGAGLNIVETLTPVYNHTNDFEGIDLEKFSNLDMIEKQAIISSRKARHEEKIAQFEKLKADKISSELEEIEWQTFLKKQAVPIEPKPE